MTTTLGSVTFLDQEIQGIDLVKQCDMLVFAIPFADSDETEAYTWGGNTVHISLRGSVHKDGATAVASANQRMEELIALMTLGTKGSQSSIAFNNPLYASPEMYVKVMNIDFSSSTTEPEGHFNFEIKLVQAAEDSD